jgi:hypothetical protein
LSAQLLFYEQAVPVSAEQHRNWAVKPNVDYSFARQVNSVPATAVEFPRAALEYVMVFAGDDQHLMPAAILGIQDKQNNYIEKSGKWLGRYVPAFVRRYPFVFSSADDKNFTLCVDGSFSGWSKEGKGRRLFDDKGERTEFLEGILKFLQQYQVEFRRTRAFCQKLKSLDLLAPVHAQFTTPDGQRRSLSGFMAVNREKLKKLPAGKLAKLASTGELELIYLHLQSLNHFEGLISQTAGKTTAATPRRAKPSAASAGKGGKSAPAAKAKPRATPKAKKKISKKKSSKG